MDTNEQAARVSASLRDELIRLGRVNDHGVPLGLQGTFAGVEGNRRGPLNRETYRVTGIRDDGGLEITTALHSDADPGERMVLPASYVAEHLALGYASTVHAAQGRTVDTTHSVVTARTAAAAFYVAISRGREANTAHVTTVTGVDDAAQGSERHSLHRDPVAAVAAILDTAEAEAPRSALAIATESAQGADSVATMAELLADAAQLAATERTATSLDRLVADGALSPDDRARIAAEDGTAALTRVLRRAELAGRDPHAVLSEAIERGPLTGSRTVTNVVYSRIQDVHRFDPQGDTWTQWVPKVDNHEWTAYLAALADAADTKTAQLGAAAAADPPAWALEAFGPVPADEIERDDWERSVGQVAGYREMPGHDDSADVLGSAPKPGQVEEFAPLQVAWHACVRRAARMTMPTKPYSHAALADVAADLPRILARSESFAGLPRLLAEVGVRLVYVEGLPGVKIDGCAMFVDGVPVVGLSGRGKRLDKVLFALLHEIAHILNGHVDAETFIVEALDDEPAGAGAHYQSAESHNEAVANGQARDWILPGGLGSLPGRVGASWILSVAGREGIAPIVLVGQLQHARKLDWRTTLARGAPTVPDVLKRWT